MRLRPYPKYTPSGTEWVGTLPEEWAAKRLKFLLAVPLKYGANEAAELDDPDLPRYVRITDIDGNDGLREETFRSLPADIAEEYLLQDGDLLFARSGATAGKTFLYRSSWGVCAFAGYLIRARIDALKCVSKFVKYFTSSTTYLQWLSSTLTQATIQNVSADRYASLLVPLPSIGEQRVIADFLDRETARIDTLVEKKRMLIERLKEKRTALISRTVTSGLPPDVARAAGLDPHPRLKPSGVAWLPPVPLHWEVRRLRHISNRITVGVVVNPSSYVSEYGVPFLLGGDIREFEIDVASCNRCTEETSNGPLWKSRLSGGDVVVVRVGYPGVAAVVPPSLEGANCASMMIVSRDDQYCSQWLAYALNSQVGSDQVEIVQYGAAQKQFNTSHAVDFTFPFPPLHEQQLIAEFLDSERARIGTLLAKLEGAIERLQEYRSALITAAVTGKIDVRNAGVNA